MVSRQQLCQGGARPAAGGCTARRLPHCLWQAHTRRQHGPGGVALHMCRRQHPLRLSPGVPLSVQASAVSPIQSSGQCVMVYWVCLASTELALLVSVPSSTYYKSTCSWQPSIGLTRTADASIRQATLAVQVMATGGLSFPSLGASGKGLSLLTKHGHALHEPYPALTPLKGHHPGSSSSHLAGTCRSALFCSSIWSLHDISCRILQAASWHDPHSANGVLVARP